jgi:hypothetical protein
VEYAHNYGTGLVRQLWKQQIYPKTTSIITDPQNNPPGTVYPCTRAGEFAKGTALPGDKRARRYDVVRR